MKLKIVCPKCSSVLEVADNDAEAATYLGKAQIFARKFSSEGDAKTSVLNPEGVENLNSFAISERFYEYAFVMEQILKYGVKGREVVDIGSAMTVLAAVISKLGNKVTCLDFQKWKVVMRDVEYVSGDIMKVDQILKNDFYDLGVCVSTIEHVGMGRWKDPEDVNGDIKGMIAIRKIIRPGGLLILTTPVGVAEVSFPAHRIYNQARLSKIFEGFTIKEEQYYRLSPESPLEFVPCNKETAFNLGIKTPTNYNIACYLLEKV